MNDVSNAEPSLAIQMLTFMIRPILKPSLSFVVATYPTAALGGESLYPVVWEVVETLELHEFHIVHSPVMELIQIGNSTNLAGQAGKSYKTQNPFSDDDFFFIFFTEMKKSLSRGTLEGLSITGNDLHDIVLIKFYEEDAYIRSEVFSQDPLERYISRQRQKGGSNDDPTVAQFRLNTAIL